MTAYMRRMPGPLVLVEYLGDEAPLLRYRVTCGDLHAVGPTEEAAMETLARAMESR